MIHYPVRRNFERHDFPLLLPFEILQGVPSPLRSIFPINLRKLCVISLNRNVRERNDGFITFFSNSSSFFFFFYGTIKTENSSKIDLKISEEGRGKYFARKNVLSCRNPQQSCNEIARKIVIITCAWFLASGKAGPVECRRRWRKSRGGGRGEWRNAEAEETD